MPDAPGPGNAATIAPLLEPLDASAMADSTLLEANPESGLQEPFAGGEQPATAAGGTDVELQATSAEGGDEAKAAETVRRYYRALDAGDFATAHRLWRDDGTGSGQTLEQFRTGFARTVAFGVQTGKATRLDAGAGQQRIEVPVSLVTTDRDGRERRSIGHYLLQPSAGTGGMESWHIASADLRELEQ